jgi:hypothetical protein
VRQIGRCRVQVEVEVQQRYMELPSSAAASAALLFFSPRAVLGTRDGWGSRGVSVPN